MHGCSIELAAETTSAAALCDRLDDLDAGDPCLELRAVRIALRATRGCQGDVSNNSVRESEVRTTLRQAL